METSGKDEVSAGGSLEEIKGLLNASNSAVALLSALGVASVGQSVWRYAHRTRDERFLVKLVKHATTLERVKEIQEYCDKQDDSIDKANKSALLKLAASLRRDANDQLRYDIGEMDWRSSKEYDRFMAGCHLVLFILLLLSLVMISSLGDSPANVYIEAILLGLSFIGAVSLTIYYLFEKNKYTQAIFDRSKVDSSPEEKVEV